MNMKQNRFHVPVTALIAFAIFLQVFTFSLNAQQKDSGKISDPFTTETLADDIINTSQSKIAPDLEEKTNDVFHGMRSDSTESVIIQLKPATRLNESLGELSDAERDEMFALEVQSNKEKKGIIINDIAEMGGRAKKSYNNLGLISADLPLSKVRELIANDEVAYISPDRETAATGHIETTTGASLVRSLVSGTTIGGNGIGIAILDSGVEANHADFKPLITSRVVYNKSFITGSTDTSDKYGHGTHVAGLASGNDIFSNNYSGYYNGTAPSANLINLKVLDDTGRGSASNVIAAIDWAITNKAPTIFA